MSTTFSITYDCRQGLVLVAGESIVTDLVGVHINRNPDGTFSCAVTRGTPENPVRLVSAVTREGSNALQQAKGQLSSSAPGFVEIPPPITPAPASTAASTLAEDIARHLGWSGTED